MKLTIRSRTGPKICAIWAENDGVIGINGDLASYDTRDMKLFKTYTVGKTILVGRKTLESFPAKLKGRETVCLTRDTSYKNDKADHIIHNPEDILKWHEKEVVICGGAEIYNIFLFQIEEAVITEFHTPLERSATQVLTKAPDILKAKGTPNDFKLIARNEAFTTFKLNWG